MSATDDLAAWLGTLPADSVVAWGDDHVELVPGVHCAWVDVNVPAACEALGWNWVWTVTAPDERDDQPDTGDGPPAVRLPYDRVVWAVWDPASHWYLPDAAAASAVGGEPTAEQLEKLAAVAAAGDGRSIEQRPGWATETIDDALARWVRDHTGRADLRFVYDAELRSVWIAELNEQLETAGVGDTYEIAPGVRASEQALDVLLAMDPDDAARLSARTLELLRDM